MTARNIAMGLGEDVLMATLRTEETHDGEVAEVELTLAINGQVVQCDPSRYLVGKDLDSLRELLSEASAIGMRARSRRQ